MKKYIVTGDSTIDVRKRSGVEINGQTRLAGEIINEIEFKPRPADAPKEELSELDSLIQSGHVALVVEG